MTGGAGLSIQIFGKNLNTYIHRQYYLKGPSPASFSFILGLFQTNINTILQQINVKTCPSSIWCWDSNPRPSEHESHPITTTRWHQFMLIRHNDTYLYVSLCRSPVYWALVNIDHETEKNKCVVLFAFPVVVVFVIFCC